MDSLSFCRCRSFSADSELPKRSLQDNATECVAGEHQLAGEGTGVRRTHQRQDGRGTGGLLVIALIALVALTLLGFWQVWYKLGKAQLENGSVRRLVWHLPLRPCDAMDAMDAMVLQVPESVDSYLKSEDATDYLEVIQAVSAVSWCLLSVWNYMKIWYDDPPKGNRREVPLKHWHSQQACGSKCCWLGHTCQLPCCQVLAGWEVTSSLPYVLGSSEKNNVDVYFMVFFVFGTHIYFVYASEGQKQSLCQNMSNHQERCRLEVALFEAQNTSK